MAMEQKLSLKLAQKLVMTPSLQQAIKLLQMTRMELEGVLAQELVENPILEENESLSEEDQRRAEDLLSSDDNGEEKPEDGLADVDLEAFFEDHAESWEGNRTTGSMFEAGELPPLENTLSREPDLYDHLMWQLQMTEVPDLTREIAELIIGNLSPEGYLVATMEEIQAMGAYSLEDLEGLLEVAVEKEDEEASDQDADETAAPTQAASIEVGGAPAVETPIVAEQAEGETDAEAAVGQDGEDDEEDEEAPAAGYPMPEVQKALELVRSFDPPGVACTTLRESLLSQLDAQGEPHDSLTWRAVEETWDLFKRRKFEAAAKALGVPLRELEPVIENLRKLETRPGREYDHDHTEYVEPDVHVVKVGEEYVVQLNDDGLPRLRVSRAYRKILKALRDQGRQEDAQQYIKEKMRSALWLIKSLDQRQRTIYKVTESIIRQQRAFFDHGLEHLRPMVLRDVAEDIEMHESTVSRVVSNKYMHTPRGLFPMKFFFHSGIDREYGGDISSLTVKRKIKQLVDDEDPAKPLSDSALMKILKREGIQIARRTVAKYRDELSIPSSTDRKRIF